MLLNKCQNAWIVPSILVKNSKFDCVWHVSQFRYNPGFVFFTDVRNNIADPFIGFQVLSDNIDIVRCQNIVYLRQHARYILVNVNQSMRLLKRR